MSGYTTPGRIKGLPSSGHSQLKMSLTAEGFIKFGTTYTPDTPTNTGTLIVITNLPESTFTIKGPATYSGSGTCWSQTNVPLGQYDINFNDVPGYEIPFSKHNFISVSSGFSLGTAEVDYKKIGEQT